MSGDRRVTEPNYTQVPNELLDDVIPEITSIAELKVTMAIVRQTFGFHRGFHLISLTDLEKLTGMTRQGCQNGVTAAMERGYVARRKGAGNAYLYGIRVSSANDVDSQRSRPGTNKGKKEHSPSVKRKRNGAVFEADPESDVDSTIVTCFEAWRDGTGRNGDTQLTVRRAGILKQRLVEAGRTAPAGSEREVALAHAREEVLEAVAGLAGSKWHRDKGVTEFDQIFRNRERVESFRDRHRRDGAGKAPSERYAKYDAVIENPDA